MKRDFSIFTGLLKTARKDDDLLLTGIASSTIKDRHGDTMTPKALESMLRSAEGMTIYLNHSYNVPEDVAGTVRQAWINKSDDELHDLHFQIAINQDNPRAVQAFNAIDKGTKLGLSIGAMIPEGGAKKQKGTSSFVIDEVELLETSIVSIPANPRSWVEYARKSLLTKGDIPETEDDEEAVELTKSSPEHNHEADQDNGETPEPKEEDDGLCDEDCCCGGIGPIGVCPDCRCSADVDVAKAKVTVWPSGKVSVDTNPSTAPSQDVDKTEPENEEPNAEDPLAAALSAMALGIEPDVQSVLGPTLLASLQTSRDLMVALVEATKEAISRAERAERDRDEAMEAVRKLAANTEAFITRVSAYPRGRRAIDREVSSTAKTIEGIKESGLFSETVIDMLQKGVNS